MIDDKEHVKLVEQLFDEKKKLFVEKNSNYGCSYLKAGRIMDVIMDGKPLILKTIDDHIAYQILTRRLDKITRFCNLRFGDEADKVGESIAETVGDDAVYAMMASSYEASRNKYEVVKTQHVLFIQEDGTKKHQIKTTSEDGKTCIFTDVVDKENK